MEENKKTENIRLRREVMKGYTEVIDNDLPDQKKLKPQPPLDKNYGKTQISLPRNFDSVIKKRDILSIITERSSIRRYEDEALTLQELSFLLWAAQGVKEVRGEISGRNAYTVRTVPSAGARHALETYLILNKVENLKPGIYHYLSLEHKLEYLYTPENQIQQTAAAVCGQYFFAGAPAAFVWTAVPYRSEWRYGSSAQKYMLLDAGHACQNLYLACEAIGCGTCAVGAYEQKEMDALLGLDPEAAEEQDAEFVIYMASVGKH